MAIQYGLPDVVRHFVELGGFDIHMHREVFFKGLLMTAILECNAKTRPQVVRLLLENGVDPNHTFTEGRQRLSGTPLQRAILKGDLETTRSLVEYGADVNATSVARHGRWNRVCSLPPLIHAMRRRSAEMVRVLLENGANRTCLSIWQTLLVKAGEEKVSDEDIVIRKGMDQAETYSFVVVKQRSKKRKGKKLDDRGAGIDFGTSVFVYGSLGLLDLSYLPNCRRRRWIILSTQSPTRWWMTGIGACGRRSDSAEL